MSKLTWDAAKDRSYEYGVSKGVHYSDKTSGNTVTKYGHGVAWDGLIKVADKPSGADNKQFYADNIEYAAIRAAEEYACDIEAYQYPDEMAISDGSASPVAGLYIRMQERKPFGLCWRTEIGNAEDGMGVGYKLHLAYGLTAAPTEESADTVNDSPDAKTFSWSADGTPVPVNVKGYKPTAKLVVDSRKVDSEKLAALEAILYGGENTEPRLPLPDEVITTLGGTLAE